VETENRKHMQQQKTGLMQVLIGYVIWGLLPIYWKFLDHVSSFEVLLHRVLWCALLAAVYFLLAGRNPVRILKGVWGRGRFGLLAGSALIVAVNWLSYIYAVTSGNILQASLGYYICPILIVLLGVLIFKESMSKLQVTALIFCIAGVIYATLRADGFPWLSLLIASTFAVYGMIKKVLGIDGVSALLSDTVMLSPPVIALIIFYQVSGEGMFLFHSAPTDLLLVGAGLATLLPLVLFIQGTIKIPYKTVGFMQFITPTMAFFLGVAVYHEPFSLRQGITFLLILLGVACYIISIMNGTRKEKHRE